MTKDLIKNYKPKCEQERIDQQAILSFLDRNPDAFYRTNLAGHMTASAIVVDSKMDKVLFAFHNIYNSWSWVGGHNDGNEDFLAVAVDEAKEETGVKNIYPYNGEILGIDTILVHNHIKKGIYVPDHLHFNLTYLLIADDSEQLVIKADENSGVKWFSIDEVLEHVSEERMKVVYQKAFHEIKRIKEKNKSKS